VRECCEPWHDCWFTDVNVNASVNTNMSANTNVNVNAKVSADDHRCGALYMQACKCMCGLVTWHLCQLNEAKKWCQRQRVDKD
jgi:hypothetical protein